MSTQEAMVRHILEQMGGGDGDKPKPPQRTMAMQARIISEMLPEVTRKNPFEVGNLVVQNPAYTQYNWPKEGEVGLVTAVLDLPPIRVDGKGRNRFDREDLVVLCNVEGKWIEFLVESWRFSKYDGPVEA